MNLNLFRLKILKHRLYLYKYYILIFLVLFYFISDILHILSSLMIYFDNYNTLDVVGCMFDNTSTSSTTTVTNSSNTTSSTTNSTNMNSNFFPDINDLNSFGQQLVVKIIEILKPVLEPVTVDYSNELLANQIYLISILLFVMCILISLLIIVFMINLIIYSYSDKLINLFKNKYVIMYINFNKKMIQIELWYLGITIVTFMYSLSKGLHFLATHPITIS